MNIELALPSLEKFLAGNGFDCVILVDQSGVDARQLGARKNPACVEALERDFYDRQTIVAFAGYLMGKKFPQISARGDCWALSGILPSDQAISMYGPSPGDIRAQIDRSKEIWKELLQIVSSDGVSSDVIAAGDELIHRQTGDIGWESLSKGK